MKNRVFLILSVCFMAGFASAQSDFSPGWVQSPTNLASSVVTNTGFQSSFQPQIAPITQTGSAIAEAITPDIQELAANLGYDPVRIYNYVHDQIRYVHYFGSKKGAELTFLERSGNDFDQCALLSALLQASGFLPIYQFGLMKMPYDSPSHQDLHHWLTLSLSNINWTATSGYLSSFMGSRGFAIGTALPGDTNDYVFQRIWVTLALGTNTYYLDPSFKVSEPVTNITLASATGFSASTLLTAAGGTDTGTYVTGLNEGSLRVALQSCNSNLLSYLSNNTPDATVAQVIGGQKIIASGNAPLPTSLAFPLYTNSNYPFLNWTNQPTNFMGKFSISFDGTNYAWFTPQLAGQRLSLTFSSNAVAQLWQEDTPLLQVNNTSPSNTVAVIMKATHPYGSWSTSQNLPVDTGYDDQSSTNGYQITNASYAIMYAFEANPAWLTERQQKLDAYLAAGYTNGSRQVTTETLNVMGLGWMVQTELARELLCQEGGQLPASHHRFGRMGQETGQGYYVDVYMQLDGTYPGTGANPSDFQAYNQEFDVSSYFWSAMEHGIIEQLQNSNLVAASTVKMLEIASTNAQKIYLASSANWSGGSGVEAALQGYSAVNLSIMSNRIAEGFTLLLPQIGSNRVAGAGSWAGDGYVALLNNSTERSLGMVIGGDYNGGYDSLPGATASGFADFASGTADSLPTFYNPQSATLPIATPTGADPVNLVDGSFQVTSTDLSLGQTEPRGLNLTRYYSSARRTSNPAGMAPGWLHSYYCNVLPHSDPESGLGTATVQQMTPMIVATYAAFNLYNNVSYDPKNWMATALIAKWGIDQLINNAVSVNLGNSTLQFIRQPNGSYTPPANCTMTLFPTNGGYWLQERHGRTFEFGTNNLLTTIFDPYGQAMHLSYNSNNLVTNVTDWVNRTLSFTYTGSNLTAVSDGTRTVSYGYTSGELTSYTDPEGKISSYQYDTNNDITGTLDALNRLVVSNVYDEFGHVTTQFSTGDTNKTWLICASGYTTVETDPAGGRILYTYDGQSRQTGFQDALGNVTQTVYDGQDHVAQTISPRNETNQFVYDDNNNLIETIDPLGHSNVFLYDGSNNLIATLDPLGHSNTFTYNSQSSVLTSTNGAGNGFALTYNPNGTVATRVDSGGTTIYNYDTYGQLKNIAYPGSLGADQFLNSVAGDVLTHTNARGFITISQYNQRRQLTNSTAPTNLTVSLIYDPVGNLQSTTDARGNATAYSWNITRHQTGTAYPATPPGSAVVTNFYDTRDWLNRTLNPRQNPSYYSNNAGQQLIAATDALFRTNTFMYDGDGDLTNSTDAAMEPTSSSYDPRGQIITVTDAAGGMIGKTYDFAGNTIYLTNRDSHVWTFQYDAANHLTNTISPTGKTVGNVFDSRGLLHSVTTGGTNTNTFFYDAKGRMTNRTDYSGANTFVYDLDDNLGTNSENGQTLTSLYDAYDRLTAFTNGNGYLIKYGYDNNGNLTSITYPGNLTVNYYYDALNRLTNVTDWSGRQTTNLYDLAGELTSISRPNGTLRTLSYDAAGETTNIVERYVNGAMAIEYIALNYNSAARKQWEFVAPLPQPYTPPSRTLTYDNDNRLATFNGTSVIVDSQGNLTYGPGTNNTFTNYTYDARNRLTGAGGLTFGYDPAGNRTVVTNGSTVTTYVIDPLTSQVLMRIRPGVTNYYIYGAGLLYEIDVRTTGTTTLFYHFDSHGSTVALTDANGNVTDRMEYSAYGMPTYRGGTNDTPFLFNGQYGVQTDANGLLFMRARYYNPYICRFLNADTSGFGGGLNMYQFANGNPISMMDPAGLCAEGAPANTQNPFNLSFASSTPISCITCHGVSASGFNGNVNSFAGLTALSGSGPNAMQGYSTEVFLSKMAAPFVAGPVGGLIGDALEAGTATAIASEGGIQTLDASVIRFSQSSVNNVGAVADNMAANGWQGAPVTVVRMADGGLTTVDNTRVLAASLTGTPVQATIVNAGATIDVSQAIRFVGSTGTLPTTWGEAVLNRIGNQNSLFRITYPSGSPITGLSSW